MNYKETSIILHKCTYRISVRGTATWNDFFVLPEKENGSFHLWVKTNALEADNKTSLTKIFAKKISTRTLDQNLLMGLDVEVIPLLNTT